MTKGMTSFLAALWRLPSRNNKFGNKPDPETATSHAAPAHGLLMPRLTLDPSRHTPCHHLQILRLRRHYPAAKETSPHKLDSSSISDDISKLITHLVLLLPPPSTSPPGTAPGVPMPQKKQTIYNKWD
jgi:hypothetical protein